MNRDDFVKWLERQVNRSKRAHETDSEFYTLGHAGDGVMRVCEVHYGEPVTYFEVTVKEVGPEMPNDWWEYV